MVGFDSYYLQRIMRENHYNTIQAVYANQRELFRNLVVTLSDQQLNIYDSKHHGEELGLFMYFRKDNISCMCWLDLPFHCNPLHSFSTFSDYQQCLATEARLCFMAVASSKTIDILSISHQKSVLQLHGHKKRVHALLQPSFNSTTFTDLLLSSSEDGIMILWHWPSKTILHSTTIHCKVLCTNENEEGRILFLNNRGKLFELEIHEYGGVFRFGSPIPLPKERKYEKLYYCKKRECLLAQTTTGKIIQWERDSETNLWQESKKWHLCHLYNSSQFSVSKDEEYICFGDDEGRLSIYHLDTCTLVKQLQYEKEPIVTKMCAFGDKDCIYHVGNSATLFQWKYVDPALVCKYQAKKNHKIAEAE